MAIDNEAKRRAVQAMTFGLVRPPPAGTITAGDRATVAWLYSIGGNDTFPIGHARIGFIPMWFRGTS